jgi:ABC-type multidrug transport system fused ATPase/permease subunit
MLVALCSYIGTLVLVTGGTRATALLHATLLQSTLRAPTSFFDTTPVGRIVNRFSKDVDTIDTLIPRNIEMWFLCAFAVAGTMLVISYSTPYFMAVLLPLGLFYYFVQV